ncbi:hypothetical protein DLAC_10284 [Tieghemostelium lacteum]|uniref:Uncharacterized protein n=1 Tax=Tieghemostelium lacteum TaxID=361077 RepID=A0A151Z545_TIELA|nr:hypothetical protein DLAC_10284 [Tieghemostelium lacteum]|eukprot:KYQ89058.1 hypothetical protein DLAC_10284 [Tieghemostelium lacteum]
MTNNENKENDNNNKSIGDTQSSMNEPQQSLVMSMLPKKIPSFLSKEMDISTFFMVSGGLAGLGFLGGIMLGFRKTGIRQTLRSAPPGAVSSALKALGAGTLLAIGSTTGLVYIIKHAYGINTVKEFGERLRNKDPSSIDNTKPPITITLDIPSEPKSIPQPPVKENH